MLTAAAVAVASGAGVLAASAPANAAGPWFVAPSGVNNAGCGLALGTPCATVTFVLTKGAFLDGDTINVAPGTYTDKPTFGAKTATLIGSGGGATFSGSNTGYAIGVAIAAAKTLTLQNLTLTQGKATNGLGGALVIATGKVVTTNVNLTGSAATNVGGGAYVPANTSLSMTGGTISGNSATNFGGAIYTNGGTVALNGTTVQGNSAVAGAGVYAQAGTVTLTNATVASNTAPAANGLGGGFAGAATLNVTGGSFTGNTAYNGGGIYNNTGVVTLNGTSMSGNGASNQGAAVFQQTGTTNLTNANLTGNNATALASVAIVGGALNTSGGSISNNTALNGAALYNGGTTVIDGTTLSGNTANGGTTANGGNAGAIYNAAALTVKNATLTGNKAVPNTAAAPGVTGYGGSILSLSVAAAGAPTLNLQNTTINGGAVSGSNAAIGGAIASIGNIGVGGAATVLTATGLTLSKNVALAGGGIYSTGPVTLNSSTLDQNRATHASAGLGGGIYATPQASTTPTLTLDNTAVTGNDGVAGGGGIVTTINTVVKNGSTVNGNSGGIGGGIYTAAPVAVQDSHVDGNSVTNSGGGIYNALGVTTLTGSSVDGNTAAFLGGGLSTAAAAGTFVMSGGTLSGNNAFGAGGAFISNSLTASFDDTDLIGNTSTGQNFGGGAILSAGQVTINKAQITGNKADGATGLGGAIFSGSSDENVTTSLKITNSTLADNEAFSAAAIYAGSSKATSTNKTSIANSTIHGNAAAGPFGALQVVDPVSIVGSTITDNTAVPTSPYDAYGGIIAQSAGQVSLSGSVVAGNSGHQCNVAVADGGYNLNSPTAAECGFTAGKNDLFAAPQLGSLANNGGPTTTRLPSATSPLLNKIATGTATGVTDAITGSAITLCTGSDQRGTSRPQGAKCDIGAVEAEQVVPTVAGPSSATYSVGIAGAPQVFTTTGSPQPTLTATGLPSGVTFVDNGDGTGTLAGTPGANTGGVHAITVKATNEAGSDSKVITLTINQAPALAGPAGATYTVGQAGAPVPFTTTGHPTSVLSSLGVLPGGVGFTDNGDGTGQYAGTPAAGTGGLYTLTVKASNGTLPDATAPFALTVREAPSLTGPGAATFKVGVSSLSGEFAGAGFPVPTLSATGLPAGLTLASTGAGTAKISGSAADGTGGLYPGVVVKAANGVGSDATKNVDVTVNEAPELVGPSEARFVTGSANEIGFSSDGFPQAAITRTGTLPAGLSFVDNGNGSAKISGTAPASAVGTYPITITASNGESPDAVIHLTLEVVPPLSISTTALPNAAYRSAYSAQLMAAGGQPGYTFQVISGQLPQGLTMNAFGQITGSPTVSAGIYLFTVKATDSADPAQTATKILKIQVTKGSTAITPTAILLGFLPNGDITLNLGLVEADLTGGFPAQPIAGATVTFKSGTATVCSGKTDAKGHAQCSQSLLNALLTPLKGNLTATFAGDLNWFGSSGSATLIQKG
ncbi:S-layer family protein [Nocardioides marmoriginsengisoli]|uniref:S-layer family protein n=1 Tax=Nocardioides marmoriginsengisoli TaxID=661483 RepID=A0A3N0CFE9_9ACTN|nr:S-layer family protein [Nocardioides marmoriginsengisoli]